ncbi:hypothetical protein [Neorhodopirellula pilleata]|nr:hypothetical protein [Neorhodopirellula pilleata]
MALFFGMRNGTAVHEESGSSAAPSTIPAEIAHRCGHERLTLVYQIAPDKPPTVLKPETANSLPGINNSESFLSQIKPTDSADRA